MVKDYSWKYDGMRQKVWDVSSLEKVMSCSYLYFLGRKGWGRAGWDPARSWGIVLHAALEAYDKELNQNGSRDEALFAGIRAVYESRSMLEGSKDTARTFETVLRAFIWYTEEYEEDPYEDFILSGDSTIEMRFEVSLDSLLPKTDYRLSGKVDKLVSTLDGLWVLDRKSTKQSLGPWFYDYYDPGVQILAYVWVFRRILGLPIRGMIIDGIQAAVGFNRFERKKIAVSDERLDEFERFLVYYILQAETAAEVDYWPQNFSSCGNYGGCDFRYICQRSPRVRNDLLERKYENRNKSKPSPDEEVDILNLN
jgi:hypothetical protein|tara:strand:- start:884 stop:1813 length:930 start_codon:yes stop_codon:yes gene_type:complete